MATMLCYACVTCLLALDMWIVVGPRSPVCLVVLHDFETSRPFDGRPHVFDNYCRDTYCRLRFEKGAWKFVGEKDRRLAGGNVSPK